MTGWSGKILRIDLDPALQFSVLPNCGFHKNQRFSQYCVCYFLNIVSNSKRNFRSKKTIPGPPRLEPHRKVNATTLCKFSHFKTLRTTTNLFSNLDFLPKSEFPKTLDLPMDFPMISHGFPTPWPGSLGRTMTFFMKLPGNEILGNTNTVEKP